MFLLDQLTFTPQHKPQAIPIVGDLLFTYADHKIGLTHDNTLPIFQPDQRIIQTETFYCFGLTNNKQCLLVPNHDPSLNYTDCRASHKILSHDLFSAVAVGNHIHYWRSAHNYCGKCGNLMMDKMDERARYCPTCHHVIYPKISPCVIVLVTRGDEILLARSPHFPTQMLSTLAGFIEIGETVEQTVVREVKEETGILVGNVNYITSQPWPFPDSLMLGFTAEYLSGELTIDNHEIEAAAWFNKNNLPLLPSELSIARYLIERHLQR